ncbi:MAG: hypothetical protein ACLFVU_03320 [Phycisphaerae bacterium]
MSTQNQHPPGETREQSPSSLDLAVEVSERVELVEVAAVSFRGQNSCLPGNELKVKLKHNGRFESRQDDGKFSILTDFRFIAVDGEQSEDCLVELGLTMRLTYYCCDFGSISEEHLVSFAQLNGVFNAWPYWREYVQSALNRLGLPSFTVPVFRLADAQDDGGS